MKCRHALAAATAIPLVAAAGCGGSSAGPAAKARSAGPQQGVPVGAAFSSLASSPVPPGWHRARTPAGATLDFPPAWHALSGDHGTLSAAVQDAAGRFLGYLNLTPRQGSEREANWASFRAAHNRAEGDRDVRVLASARGLRFRNGQGACVKDAYTTSIGTHYIELACLIEGGHPTVVLGAAPPLQWPIQGPIIARAISAVAL